MDSFGTGDVWSGDPLSVFGTPIENDPWAATFAELAEWGSTPDPDPWTAATGVSGSGDTSVGGGGEVWGDMTRDQWNQALENVYARGNSPSMVWSEIPPESWLNPSTPDPISSTENDWISDFWSQAPIDPGWLQPPPAPGIDPYWGQAPEIDPGWLQPPPAPGIDPYIDPGWLQPPPDPNINPGWLSDPNDFWAGAPTSLFDQGPSVDDFWAGAPTSLFDQAPSVDDFWAGAPTSLFETPPDPWSNMPDDFWSGMPQQKEGFWSGLSNFFQENPQFAEPWEPATGEGATNQPGITPVDPTLGGQIPGVTEIGTTPGMEGTEGLPGSLYPVAKTPQMQGMLTGIDPYGIPNLPQTQLQNIPMYGLPQAPRSGLSRVPLYGIQPSPQANLTGIAPYGVPQAPGPYGQYSYENLDPNIRAGIEEPYQRAMSMARETLAGTGGLGSQRGGITGSAANVIGQMAQQAAPKMAQTAWGMMAPGAMAQWGAELGRGQRLYEAGTQQELENLRGARDVWQAGLGRGQRGYETGIQERLQDLLGQRALWGADVDRGRLGYQTAVQGRMADIQNAMAGWGAGLQRGQTGYQQALQEQMMDYQGEMARRGEFMNQLQMPYGILPGMLGGTYSTPMYQQGGGGLGGGMMGALMGGMGTAGMKGPWNWLGPLLGGLGGML